MMKNNSKVLVTGSSGMVGKALVQKLKDLGYTRLFLPSSKELDLINQEDVNRYFKENDIEFVFHLAARVGGIAANISSPAEFLYNNMMIESNVIESARKYNVEKLIFLGSSCIYPRDCPQPMKEEYLLSGKLEPTNEAYALAKIAGLKMCEYYNKQYCTDFISLMPCNLYGPNDHFEEKASHVISALLLKFHNAKQNNLPSIDVWGTGKARREFLFVEDLIDAMIHFISKYDAKDIPAFVNTGYGKDISIKELAELIKKITGYKGEIMFNPEKPDGMPKKLLDSSKAEELGWRAKTELEEGLKITYEWFKDNKNN